MNRKADYIFFYPPTRYFLIQNILGKRITNVFRNTESKQKLNKMQNEIASGVLTPEAAFCSAYASYTIEFEGNILVDVSREGTAVMIKHANRYGYKWYVYGFMYQPAPWSLKDDLFKNCEMAQIIGQKLVNVSFFVATMPSQSIGRFLSLELSDESSLTFGLVGGKPFESLLYVAPNDPFLKNLEKNELSLEMPNLDYEMLEDYWAAPSELVDNEYIELYYTNKSNHPIAIDTDIYWDKLSKKPIENYEILKSILSDIFQFQMGIIDLRFGLTRDGELRLVRPLDLCVKRIYDNNIYFINSLMNTIYKHIPEKLEQHFYG